MNEIDKVTRLLELATLYRLREELDLAAPGTAQGPESFNQTHSKDPDSVAESENAEPVGR
jgi:hypothetical protein